MAAPSARPSMGPRLNDGRILVECIAFDEDVPDLPSRPLRHGEALVFYDSDDDTCDEIRLGWTCNANSDQTSAGNRRLEDIFIPCIIIRELHFGAE
jgi:hypothetical protein